MCQHCKRGRPGCPHHRVVRIARSWPQKGLSTPVPALPPSLSRALCAPPCKMSARCSALPQTADRTIFAGPITALATPFGLHVNGNTHFHGVTIPTGHLVVAVGNRMLIGQSAMRQSWYVNAWQSSIKPEDAHVTIADPADLAPLYSLAPAKIKPFTSEDSTTNDDRVPPPYASPWPLPGCVQLPAPTEGAALLEVLLRPKIPSGESAQPQQPPLPAATPMRAIADADRLAPLAPPTIPTPLASGTAQLEEAYEHLAIMGADSTDYMFGPPHQCGIAHPHVVSTHLLEKSFSAWLLRHGRTGPYR